jgi:hypothetical protein
MKYALEVGGDIEKYMLEYAFNPFLGKLVIKVNDKPLKTRTRLLNEPATEVHDLSLGQQEKISVRIEKERKFLLGQKNRVFVNDRLVKTFVGI